MAYVVLSKTRAQTRTTFCRLLSLTLHMLNNYGNLRAPTKYIIAAGGGELSPTLKVGTRASGCFIGGGFNKYVIASCVSVIAVRLAMLF